jgi:Uncharacterized conserved protein (DUF2303)
VLLTSNTRGGNVSEEEIRKGDVQAALDELGRRGQVEYLTDGSGGASVPVALLPSGVTAKSLKSILDEYLPRPERRRGTVVITELTSLAEYINLYKAAETLVYIDDRDLTAPRISVVFDEHEPLTRLVVGDQADGPQAGPPAPGWREHRASYLFPLTPEWQAWVEVSKKALTQGGVRGLPRGPRD